VIASLHCAFYELEQVRTVFEAIGTREPERIWESLLRLARDLTGAAAIQGFTAEGVPGERLAENPTPVARGLREVLEHAIKAGRRE
jgi:hypothetical protein